MNKVKQQHDEEEDLHLFMTLLITYLWHSYSQPIYGTLEVQCQELDLVIDSSDNKSRAIISYNTC